MSVCFKHALVANMVKQSHAVKWGSRLGFGVMLKDASAFRGLRVGPSKVAIAAGTAKWRVIAPDELFQVFLTLGH